MRKRIYSVTAHWDDLAKVFYSDSDIIGLHIEAETIEVFEDLMMETAPGLFIANHVSKAEMALAAPKDLIPTILWQRPTANAILRDAGSSTKL